MKTNTPLDRLAMRTRPEGSPIMRQNWDNLLFLHWRIDASLLRPLIPEPLEIDTFDGSAWLGITPFAVTGLRLSSLPPVPGLDAFIELNVRTYVHFRGMPGVWFFSLDASKAIPAAAARILFMLPYFKAQMTFDVLNEEFRFHSKRAVSPEAEFQARWRTGMRLRDPDPESLTFFLVERYALFAARGREIRMARVYHHPWILNEAAVDEYHSTVVKAIGLPEPDSPPLTHFSRTLNVEIWPPAKP